MSDGVDPAWYREVMGHYPTGVAVVTGTDPDGLPVGMVIGTFASVSMEPPLVSFMPARTAARFARMRESAAFCVNVLAHDQLDLCRAMTVPAAQAFDRVSWRPSVYGAPQIENAVAHIHCRLHDVIPAGDHDIVLCEVLDMEVTRPVTPLLFFQGGYGGFNPQGLSAQADGDLIAAVRLAEVARPEAQSLAHELGGEVSVLVAVNDRDLTTAVSAIGDAVEMEESLGERVPLIPPIGEGYVAFRPAAEREAWVARSASADPRVLDMYRQRLALVRQRGYALSTLADDAPYSYQDLRDAMREYGGGPLTPAREREVMGVLAQAGAFFAPVQVTPDGRYDLGSIVVPVFGPDEALAMCLRVRQVPAGISGEVVVRWVSLLQAAAANVHDALVAAAADSEGSRGRPGAPVAPHSDQP